MSYLAIYVYAFIIFYLIFFFCRTQDWNTFKRILQLYLKRMAWHTCFDLYEILLFIFSTSFNSNFTHYKVQIMFKRWKRAVNNNRNIFCINCALIPHQDSNDTDEELSLSSIAGIFYILIVGLIIALVVSLLEFWHNSKKQAEKSKASPLFTYFVTCSSCHKISFYREQTYINSCQMDAYYPQKKERCIKGKERHDRNMEKASSTFSLHLFLSSHVNYSESPFPCFNHAFSAQLQILHYLPY